MTSYAIRADRGPAEVLRILDRGGQRNHLNPHA